MTFPSKTNSSAMKTNHPITVTRASNRTAAAERASRRTPGWPYCLQPGRANYNSGPLADTALPFYVHLSRSANRASSSSCEQRLNAAPPS
ncbi:MAG: hypothetical protein QM691_11460 [Opitutaceae bacterium]